jgi:capsular polysaccharide biosynthesis protein
MPHEKENFSHFWSFLNKKKLILLYTVLVFIMLGLGFSLIKPMEYSSQVSLLIIQKINPNLDAYTAARAAEKLGKNLTSVIYTTSFYEKVIHSNFDLKLNLPTTEREKRKAWQKKVDAKIDPDTSIIQITAYDQDRNEAEKLAQVISYILSTEGKEYHGGGDDIVIKPVNTALTSDYPTRPNIVLNLLASVVLGLILGLLIVFWQFNKHSFKQ